jgi:hypothetical protein
MFALVVIIIGLVATVLLMLTSYGTDGDAARAAASAARLFREGVYVPSRIPGYPLFEGSLALVVPWSGHVGANLFVFGFYCGAVAAFACLVRSTGDKVIIAIFALTPILLLNAATTMDYVPALALVLWSYVVARQGKSTLAFFLVAVAGGFRLTSLLFVGLLFLYGIASGWRFLRTAILSAASIALGLAWYYPVFRQVGFQMFTDLPRRRFTPMQVLQAGYNGISFLGPAATVGLLILALVFWRRLAICLRGGWSTHSPELIVEVGGVVGFGLLFVLHPDEPAYLLPALPFLCLFLARWLPTPSLVIAGVLIVAASVATIELKGGVSGHRRVRPRLAWGTLVMDYQHRREIQAMREYISQLAWPDKSVIMTAFGPILTFDNPSLVPVELSAINPRLPQEAVRWDVHQLKGRQVFFVYLLSRRQAEVLQKDGHPLFVFSVGAPSAAKSWYDYDPVAMGFLRLNVHEGVPFYLQALPGAAQP